MHDYLFKEIFMLGKRGVTTPSCHRAWPLWLFARPVWIIVTLSESFEKLFFMSIRHVGVKERWVWSFWV